METFQCSLPWGNSHVLATKLALGASTGDTQRYGSFRLGGSFGESGYYTLPDELRALRGFDIAAVSGDTYYLSSIEYRFPLWYADFGIGTLPIFARNLSAAVYLDGGNAFDDWENTPAPLLGGGFEMQARIIASWGAPISLRGGYAFGLNGGIPIGSVEGFYFWFGSSF